MEDGASGDAHGDVHEDAHQTYLKPNFRDQERNNYLEDIPTFYWTVQKEVIEGRSPAVRERAADSSFASSSEFLSAPFQRLRTQCHALFMEDRTIVRRLVMEERLE